MSRRAHKIVTTLLTAALLAAGPAVTYAAQTGTPPASQGQQTTAHYSHQQLQHFVAAFRDIKHIQKQLTQQLKGVGNKKQAQKMQHQAMQKMVKAVEAHHLSAKQYNNIAIHARHNAKLRSRIMKMIHGS